MASPDTANAAVAIVAANAAAPGIEALAGAWDMVSSGEGSGLFLARRDGERLVHLFCPAGDDDLLVNVPGFRPVGSEERMSLGAGGAVVALVADPAGDPLRGGVTGVGPVPTELAAILAGRPAINYGAQTNGPHPAPPAEMARDFVIACTD
ncbi:hypothetical protein D1610_09795 [Sphingomonas gilva]|uniref:Uncharacterized protein n=1 Tax=Sphingomonas gilva TaxID=2305907 RepID=A0A396RPG2_9SPHN|nr:hypothetical protein [Sphingomonas gilva]RHW17716.1 hypothetical protein D1610_09795 [Sphingomonas gilva]